MEQQFIPHIGTDESGKGDFFGPLVIAGVLVNEKSAEIFRNLGIKDSKKLTDKKILSLSTEIKKNAPHSVIIISNQRYNELYSGIRNLNKLLAWGHARAIENILNSSRCSYALSDKFGDESYIENALMKNGKSIELKQMIKAESDIAVASASVLARAAFVQKLDAMGKTFDMIFQKGCSPLVKDTAALFIQKYGKERLHEVCKTHFKTFKEL